MLTPSHLLYGRRLLSLPEEGRDEEEEHDTGLLRRFRYLARLRSHFWNRWHREYLTDLREQHRGGKGHNARITVGEVVLVDEDNVQRSDWKIGKVVQLIEGQDRQVRGARVKLIPRGKPTFVNKPLQRLYPLEVCSTASNAKVDPGESAEFPTVGRGIPSRAAALDARWRTRAMLDH